MILSRNLLYVIFLLLTPNLIRVANAAHSRRRVVAVRRGDSSENKYDRSITSFNPTGRLLQVEYGMAATLRGESVTALLQDDESILVLVSKDNNHDNHQNIAAKVHRIDEHLWLFTAGLSGDARILAVELRSYCQEHRLSYGEAITVEELARMVATVQHDLTRTGGARPLGCTAIIVGMNPSTYKDTGRSRIFRSDPGGILEDCVYCCAGKDQERFMAGLRNSYDTIRSCDTISAAQQLLSTVKKDRVAGDEVQEGFDFWLFRPNAERRGKSQATCFLDVGTPESLEKIRRHLTNGNQ